VRGLNSTLLFHLNPVTDIGTYLHEGQTIIQHFLYIRKR